MKLFFWLFLFFCAFLGFIYLLKETTDLLFQFVGIGIVAALGTCTIYEMKDLFQSK